LDTMPDLTKRYETILDALREANRLFNRWDQDTDAEEIQHLHQDGSSELNDHWERIRWSTEWLVKPQNREGSTAPDGSHLKLLYHLRSVINEMESHMAELLDPDTGNYGLFIDYFETSLAQVRRMQAAIQDSILDAVARRDGITEQNLTPLGQRFRMDLCPSPTCSFLRNRPRYVGEPDNIHRCPIGLIPTLLGTLR